MLSPPAPAPQTPARGSAIVALLVLLVLLPSACGAPASSDVADEIMAGTGGAVGIIVPLKTSKTFQDTSLEDAEISLLGLGWQMGNVSLCKAIAPNTWSNVKSYEFPGALVGAKSERTFHLRVCATQLTDPKAIAAIGLVVSSQKLEPYKPT